MSLVADATAPRRWSCPRAGPRRRDSRTRRRRAANLVLIYRTPNPPGLPPTRRQSGRYTASCTPGTRRRGRWTPSPSRPIFSSKKRGRTPTRRGTRRVEERLVLLAAKAHAARGALGQRRAHDAHHLPMSALAVAPAAVVADVPRRGARGAATTLRALPPDTHLSDRRGPRGTTPPSRPGGIAAAPVRALRAWRRRSRWRPAFAGAGRPRRRREWFCGRREAGERRRRRGTGDGVVVAFCADVTGVLRFASAKPASDAISRPCSSSDVAWAWRARVAIASGCLCARVVEQEELIPVGRSRTAVRPQHANGC